MRPRSGPSALSACSASLWFVRGHGALPRGGEGVGLMPSLSAARTRSATERTFIFSMIRAPVDLHGLLGRADLGRDHLVPLAGDHVGEHLALARRELAVVERDVALRALLGPGEARPLDGPRERGEQRRGLDGLQEEVDRAALHRGDGAGHVAVAREEDHRDLGAHRLEAGVQVQAALARAARCRGARSSGPRRTGRWSRNSSAVAKHSGSAPSARSRRVSEVRTDGSSSTMKRLTPSAAIMWCVSPGRWMVKVRPRPAVARHVEPPAVRFRRASA